MNYSSNSKKITVVDDIIRHLDLKNAQARWIRSENIAQQYDHIVGRAVTAIPNFLDFTCHLLNEHNHNSSIFYLKGGEFLNELKDANIEKYKIYPVRDLLPLDSDKFVLNIPGMEVKLFRERKLKAASKEVISPKSRDRLRKI